MKEKKMANKKKLWGMLAVMLAFTVVITGCSPDGDDDENTDPKKITVTGIPNEITGAVKIGIGSENKAVAVGSGTIVNNSVTVSLKKSDEKGIPTDNDWTGTGSFMVMLLINDTSYLYTNGADFNGVNTDAPPQYNYNITSAVSTIPFNKFKQSSQEDEDTSKDS
jgi:hypothetical protein